MWKQQCGLLHLQPLQAAVTIPARIMELEKDPLDAIKELYTVGVAGHSCSMVWTKTLASDLAVCCKAALLKRLITPSQVWTLILAPFAARAAHLYIKATQCTMNPQTQKKVRFVCVDCLTPHTPAQRANAWRPNETSQYTHSPSARGPLSAADQSLRSTALNLNRRQSMLHVYRHMVLSCCATPHRYRAGRQFLQRVISWLCYKYCSHSWLN